MNLSIRLFASLRERARADRIEIDVADGATIADLKREIERQRPELGSLAHGAGGVGTTDAPGTRVLRAGDEVALLPPVSGGAPGADDDLARGVFELSAQPIDPAAVARRVGHPACGAIATFTGTTRDENRGAR